MTGRDELLGHELRLLEVPEHGPDFFPRLAERLDQEASGDRRARRRGWQRPPMLLAAAAAVFVAALVARTLLPTAQNPARPPNPAPRLISATEVRSKVSSALGGLRSFTGDLTIECSVSTGSCSPPAGGTRSTERWSFVTTAAGDERVTSIGRQNDVAYSATAREQRAVSNDGRTNAVITSNLPPGPPDFAAQPSVLHRDVASAVRAFLDTTGEVPVTEITEQGRAAWRLVTPVVPNKLAGPGGSGDQLEVIVDRQSGFPLRITETLAGKFLDEIRLSNLVVDGPVDPASFVLQVPAGVKVFRQDVGFRRVTFGQVAAVVGYQPLLPAPASLPPGYQIAEVTVASQAQSTGSEGGNPQSRNVVSVAYRRGFDRILVTTRSVGTVKACSGTTGSGATCWTDPISFGEGFVEQPQPFTVGGGALAGAHAELVISPRGVPHVWTIDSQLVVTVAGDANAEVLRRLAASFAPAA